jgi:hypothetical protein
MAIFEIAIQEFRKRSFLVPLIDFFSTFGKVLTLSATEDLVYTGIAKSGAE